jgi:hypothetical protein
MSKGQFRIPPSGTFEISFSMELENGKTFISQDKVVLSKAKLPFGGSYQVHSLAGSTRAANVAATITFEISHQPN